MSFEQTMKHKVAGLPTGVWLIAIVAVGGFVIYRRVSGGSSAPTAAGPMSDNVGAYGPIDPNTGIPYSLEQESGAGLISGTGSPSYAGPSAQQEIQDVAGIISSIEPLLNMNAPAPSRQFTPLGSGGVVLDLNSGKTFDTTTGNEVFANDSGGFNTWGPGALDVHNLPSVTTYQAPPVSTSTAATTSKASPHISPQFAAAISAGNPNALRFTQALSGQLGAKERENAMRLVAAQTGGALAPPRKRR